MAATTPSGIAEKWMLAVSAAVRGSGFSLSLYYSQA